MDTLVVKAVSTSVVEEVVGTFVVASVGIMSVALVDTLIVDNNMQGKQLDKVEYNSLGKLLQTIWTKLYV